MIRQILRRRIPQILLGYFVGAWGLIEFMQFVEMRYALSPAWVDIVGLSVLLMIPAVVLLAWVHGAPGPDRLNRPQSAAIGLNVLATLVVLFVGFDAADLGAVTQTITVENEEGEATERQVPRDRYRHSLANFPLLFAAAELEEDWMRAGIAYLVELDLTQDPFIDVASFLEHAEAARRAGVEDLSSIPRPLQRQIAKDRLAEFYLWSQLSHVEEDLVVEYVVYETETGREAGRGEVRAPDVYTLADELSLQIRQAMGVPEISFTRYPDLPVADLATSSPDALRHFILGVEQALWENDFASAYDHLQAATETDPGFAIAQLNLFGVAQNVDQPEVSEEAIAAAMQHIYRVPERLQHLIKANYYFHEQEHEKGMAVLEMWRQLSPEDVLPRQLLAQQCELRGEGDRAIQMLEEVLEIDPSAGETWRQLGQLHQNRSDFERAEECFEEYVERYPESVAGLISLAACYELQGKLDQARQLLDQASLIDPNDVEVLGDLADLSAKSGRFEVAEETYQKALERARTPTESAELMMSRVSYFSNRGQADRALEEFLAWQAAAEQVYPPVQFLVMKSVNFGIYAEAGESEVGLAELEEIRQALTPPTDRFIAFGEARIHLVDQDTLAAAGAIDEIEAAIEAFGLDQLKRIAISYRAWNAALRGDYDVSVRLWRESMESERPRNYQDLGLGRALRLSGRLDEAVKALSGALERNPYYGRANLEMGLVELERGNATAAREHLDRALRIWDEADEDHRWAAEARAQRASLGDS